MLIVNSGIINRGTHDAGPSDLDFLSHHRSTVFYAIMQIYIYAILNRVPAINKNYINKELKKIVVIIFREDLIVEFS